MKISKFDNNNVKVHLKNMLEGLNISLPKQYEYFLNYYNGGYTPKTSFKAGKVSSDIRGFYGVGNVEISLNELNLQDWVNKGYFPIACDSFGNHIVIGVSEKIFNKIYFIDHENSDLEICIANDLVEFLSYCKSEKVSSKSRMSIEERAADLRARGKENVINDSLRKMWQNEIDKYGNIMQEEVEILL